MNDVKCPYCGSSNVEYTSLGYAENAASFIGGMAVGLGTSFLTSMIVGGKGIGGFAAAKKVHNSIKQEYQCKKCKRTFHAQGNHYAK